MSVVLIAGMAVSVKFLGGAIPTGEIIFVRGLISIAVLAGLAWRVAGLHLLKTNNLRSHARRSLLGTVSMFCYFIALPLIPYADFTAITFTTPIFLTILAMLFLGERIHLYRWSALIVGLVGVLIMIAPLISFGGESTIGATLTLIAAISSALAMMVLRAMSGAGAEHAITITFYFSLTTMLCSALTIFWGWPLPSLEQWLVIGLASLFGVFGQLLMTYSYRYAEASTIAPLDYTSLLTAVILGYLLFDEIPGLSVWIGAPLVIVAGMVILWREYRGASLRRSPTAAPTDV